MGSRVRQHCRRQLLALGTVALPLLPLAGLPLAAGAQTVLPGSPPGSGASRQVLTVGGPLELKVRRLPDAVEVVVEGVGETPQLQQSTRGPVWEGLLFTGRPTSLKLGPQRIGLPEAGFASISLDGAGSGYRIVVTPMQGAGVPRPVVSADGRDLILSFAVPTNPQLQTATPSLTTPGRVSDPSFVPPLQQRAVAPPVGDMAVGTMVMASPGAIKVSGPAVTMTLRNAPVKDVLMALSQMGRYGFAFIEDCKNIRNEQDKGLDCDAEDAKKPATANRKITISFRNEDYSQAINAVLLSANLQGKVQGRIIFAGQNVLGKSLGKSLSKVFRLNQVSADSAADYLASLGAIVNKTATTQRTNLQTQASGSPGQSSGSSQSESSTKTEIQTFGAPQGPLQGLIGTTDARLDTITLVGDPYVVGVAEGYLRQLDLRQRQVALSVKILDVTLDNDTSIENSFAFRYGNNFIVNDRGELQGAFNSLLPPQSGEFAAIAAGLQPLRNPGQAYARDNFYDLVRATIESRSTKVLASPTLILTDNPTELRKGSEQSLITQSIGDSTSSSTSSNSSNSGGALIGRTKANEAFVTVGEQVITNYEIVQSDTTNNSATYCQPDFSVAGLTFGARVNKIDDNGFVTFSISPTITATTRTQDIPNCGPIDILAIRSLDSGSARVRDGQTLIMTGVISDLDSQVVKKWPILGDIPLVGQFFRDTQGTRRKRELVILVTPRILRDDQGGAFGYGYQPSIPQTRDFLRQAGG